MRTLVLILLLSGCAEKMYAVNRQINSYKYIPDTIDYMKTPGEFYRDGGGDCEDFANAKKAILGGELVVIPLSFPESHVMLKVNGYLLDNRTDKIIPASSMKTYKFRGNDA